MRMPATIAALQQGLTIRTERLVALDFASGSKFLHRGFGPIRTADGTVWEGIGTLGQISDIDRSLVPSNGGPTLTLSGVDRTLIANTITTANEVKGRPVRVFDQHFDPDWRLLDAPLAVYTGLMDRISIQDDGKTATITVSTVTLLYNRRRPAFGYLGRTVDSRLVRFLSGRV
jgi:hypothetical protein